MKEFNHDSIYDHVDNEFSVFSQCEDYLFNLSNFLDKSFCWEDKSVLELGIGFGRITDVFIDKINKLRATDKSEAMINHCINKYQIQNKDLRFLCCNHENAYKLFEKDEFDFFVSSYSICYVTSKCKNKKMLLNTLDRIFSINCKQFIIIENTGIFSNDDEYIKPYYAYFDYLTSKFSYKEILTDFKFDSNEDAVKYSRIFFGEKIANEVKRSGSNIVPEKTKVWYNLRGEKNVL